jgi:putative oxidoreductase
MKNRILQYESIDTNLATLLLRLIFGILFMYYGYTKLVGFNDILPMFPDYIGIGSKLSLVLVVFAELVGGFLIAIGLFTRLSVVPIFICMIVAYFMAHAKDPFQVKQLAFVYLLLSIVIFVLGSGKFSIDKLIFGRKN